MSKSKYKNIDFIIGISLFILSLFCYFVLIPNYISIDKRNLIKADLFPKMAVLSFGGLSLLLAILSLKNNMSKHHEKAENKDRWGLFKAITTMVMIGLYILTIKINYFITTTTLLICLMLIFGHKKLPQIIIIALSTTILTYYIFFKVMMIPLP